ncbi:hypothetical protein DT075_01585 [Bacillus licheniformis]|nr:hypothetical protein DT075_01585 [Bacillus licheniformis]
MADMTPDLGRYGFPHFRFFEFFISHGIVVLACLLMIAAERYKPTVRSLWVTFLLVNVYGALIFLINRLLKAVLIISEIGYHSWFVYVNSWTPRYCLPLHLSDLSVYLVIILLLTKNLNLFKFLYFAGLGSALQAIHVKIF